MIPETDRAYIAGLFDGEGSIHFKRGIEKKKKHKGEGYRLSNSMRINMEITMTDYSVLVWVHETLGVGTLRPKTVKGRRKDGTKYLKQYKWRATFRDAYYVCCLIWPSLCLHAANFALLSSDLVADNIVVTDGNFSIVTGKQT